MKSVVLTRSLPCATIKEYALTNACVLCVFHVGAQFTCFTSTKVQKLTQERCSATCQQHPAL